MAETERPVKRNTRQRQAVMRELGANLQFRSAQTIHEDLADSGQRIGLATVYRNLRALADEGEVDVLMAGDGEALYRRCDVDTHHHHLVCRHCLRTEEIEATSVEKWVKSLGSKFGYVDLEHNIEVYGTCRKCQ
ncbi:MAG: transcriptional repressor [Actinomycetaceae bacterium]|nr:transcriptional repressor [Actinomycetaceae bacterium]